jgi:hypothetical protein
MNQCKKIDLIYFKSSIVINLKQTNQIKMNKSDLVDELNKECEYTNDRYLEEIDGFSYKRKEWDEDYLDDDLTVERYYCCKKYDKKRYVQYILCGKCSNILSDYNDRYEKQKAAINDVCESGVFEDILRRLDMIEKRLSRLEERY